VTLFAVGLPFPVVPLIAGGVGLAVVLYLVLFFAVLHLVDSLASCRPEGEDA